LLPRPQEADEARRLVLAQIVLVKSSDFVQETQPAKKHRPVIGALFFLVPSEVA
jgi:hypothetical protein